MCLILFIYNLPYFVMPMDKIEFIVILFHIEMSKKAYRCRKPSEIYNDIADYNEEFFEKLKKQFIPINIKTSNLINPEKGTERSRNQQKNFFKLFKNDLSFRKEAMNKLNFDEFDEIFNDVDDKKYIKSQFSNNNCEPDMMIGDKIILELKFSNRCKDPLSKEEYLGQVVTYNALYVKKNEARDIKIVLWNPLHDKCYYVMGSSINPDVTNMLKSTKLEIRKLKKYSRHANDVEKMEEDLKQYKLELKKIKDKNGKLYKSVGLLKIDIRSIGGNYTLKYKIDIEKYYEKLYKLNF